jgi:hypothetical protein
MVSRSEFDGRCRIHLLQGKVEFSLEGAELGHFPIPLGVFGKAFNETLEFQSPYWFSFPFLGDGAISLRSPAIPSSEKDAAPFFDSPFPL